MVRSVLVLSVVPALAAAASVSFSAPANLETFPTIINDLSSSVYNSGAPVPTGSAAPVNPYPTGSAPGSETATPTEGTPSATGVPYPSGSGSAPYPSGSGSGSEAPVPTETGGPVYGGGSSTAAPEPTTVATSYAPPAGTSAEAPVATGPSNSTGVAVGVKLPVVLGAMAIGFAML